MNYLLKWFKYFVISWGKVVLGLIPVGLVFLTLGQTHPLSTVVAAIWFVYLFWLFLVNPILILLTGKDLD